MNKHRISSKPLTGSDNLNQKPSTAVRAAITADIKPTRGKQLVEHEPFSLIPDPNNPRPGEIIDDAWLLTNLKLKTANSLCYKNETTSEYQIPTFEELNLAETSETAESYMFLRELAFSIRRDGLIEPIEIYLADKNNDPEYFINREQDYGYVVLEGHQRRLAAMMAGVSTVTCIEITDETTLARLKVKHRKLRRQLSENNIRKALSVSQNFMILNELLQSEQADNFTIKELSEIIALNEDIVGSLRKACLSRHLLPKEFFEVISLNLVTYSWIRKWVNKDINEILAETQRLKLSDRIVDVKPKIIEVKSRGKQGGAVKRSAIFKISNEKDSIVVQNFLVNKIPELADFEEDKTPFHNLEKMFVKLLALAKNEKSDPDRI